MSRPYSENAVSAAALPLRPFITKYAGFYAQGIPPGTHQGLPSRHVDLIISLGRPIDIIRMPSAAQPAARLTAFVSGLQDAPATMQHDGNLHGLHIFLTPLGVRAILGVSSSELASQVVELSAVWGVAAASRFVERLLAAQTWQQRFSVLDEEFLRALTPINTSRELVWAWDRLMQTQGRLPIRNLAQELGWSRRHFGERFRVELGLTPKTAARIFRFEQACRLIRDEQPSLAEAAFISGFNDQAHMTREWKALAGCTPKAWIAAELPFLQDYELATKEDEA
jgi:AraC-like DNA-binding protein